MSASAITERCAVESPAIAGSRVGAPAAYALAAAGGLAYAAGFPPFSWSFAPWLALAPLLIACAALPPARAALAGMVWAAVAAAVVASFVPGMVSAYFGLGILGSWLATLIIVVALHGVYIGAYAAWIAWLVRREAAHPLLVAGGWLACEVVRAHSPFSTPWALSAYSQVHWPLLIQIADLAGAYGIGLLIAVVNAVIAAALMPALRGRRPLLSAAAAAAMLAGTALYGHWRLDQVVADGPPLRVAVVQAGASPAQHSERAERLARYVALTRRAAAAQPALIVWPEYATEAYLEEPSAERDAVLGLADELRVDLILGAPHFEPWGGASAPPTLRYHNSAYLVRDGRLGGRYDKHRLVPFAEAAYSAGTGSFLLAGTDLRAGALLCFEAMFAELAAAAVREGADVLVTLSNDAWFGRPEAARQQLEIATLRAVENRRYLVRAAATGFSAVVDPHGRILAESRFDAHETIDATIHASHTTSPYQRWGDAPAWLIIAAVAAASLRAAAARRPRQHHRRFRMRSSFTIIALALGLAIGSGGVANAGAPQPDQRQGEFAHVCAGGANKGLACTVPTQDADCPKSTCVLQPLSKSIKGTLTMIAHDQVTDWSNGVATHRALTVLLEVKAPDGSKQMLAATYQDIDTPTEPPTAPGNVVAIAMDELAVNNLAKAINGLLFVQPETALSQQLQVLFSSNGTPALVAVNDRKIDFAEHGGDALATVLRFKVKIQFLDPA